MGVANTSSGFVGQRLFSTKFGKLRLPEGGYGRDVKGRMWCRPPGFDMMWVPEAVVTEYPDETVTTAFTIDGFSWKLDRGVWIVSSLYLEPPVS